MIDTNSVNYVLNKMVKMYEAVAPTVQNVGEKYVHYVVTKQIALTATMLFFILVSFLFVYLGFSSSKKSKTFEHDYKTDVHEIFTWIYFVCGGVGIVLFTILFSYNSYQTAIAVINPEIFSVEYFIKENVKKNGN